MVKFSSRGSAPHPAGAPPQTPVCTHTPVAVTPSCPPRGRAVSAATSPTARQQNVRNAHAALAIDHRRQGRGVGYKLHSKCGCEIKTRNYRLKRRRRRRPPPKTQVKLIVSHLRARDMRGSEPRETRWWGAPGPVPVPVPVPVLVPVWNNTRQDN